MLASLEDSSLRDNLKLRGQFFAFLKLVNSIAEGALSPRSGDEISPCFQPVFLVDSIHSCDSSFSVHSCVYWIPYFPTSVVLHNDKENGYGCVGSRPSSRVIETHHGSGAWCKPRLFAELGV